MDPLTCLSVAGTAVQFLQYSTSIIKESWKIYKSGDLEVRAQAATAGRELRNFSIELRQSLRADGIKGCSTEQEAALEVLCHDCIALADDLITRLDNLKFQKGQFWKSLSQVLSSAWNKEEIIDIEKRLGRYMVAINTRILGGLRNGIDDLSVQQSIRFDTLDHQTQQILTALLDVKATLTRDFEAQTAAIAQLLNRRTVIMKSNTDEGQFTVTDITSHLCLAATGEERLHFRDIQDEEAMIHMSIAEEILRSLSFNGIDDRFDEVAEAHQKTLSWIFEGARKDTEGKHWTNFVQWLRTGDGLYWINGKAASGKSTLMKYIYLHPDLQRHLSVWANGSPYHVAGFFFWNSGTKLQRSQSGLFRSLLYEVLRKVPRLIPVVLPQQWAARYASKIQPAQINVEESWWASALSKGFQTLTTQVVIPIKLCLFIDGLDEYEDDDIDMPKLFKPVAALPHIKICASSRPHVVFEDAFKSCPGLRLEDHTQLGIRHFVSDNFLNDESMQQVREREPEKSSAVAALEDEIIVSANGVFLWVQLVVKSLLNGIRQHDRISDLQRRLHHLPKKIEQLYELMVIQVDDVYKQEASRLFQLMDTSQSRNTDWEEEVQPLTIFGMSLAMEYDIDFALAAGLRFMSESAIEYSCQEMDSRLRSRCGGLLEVSSNRNFGWETSKPLMKVGYLHRTVRDFLVSRETREVLADRTSGNATVSFNPDMALLTTCLLLAKASIHQSLHVAEDIMSTAVNHSLRLQANSQTVAPEFYDQLWDFLVIESPGPPKFLTRGHPSLLSLATSCGLNHYLHYKLPSIPVSIVCPQSGRPLLDVALNPTPQSALFVNENTIKELLAYGARPNQALGRWSPWQNALSYLDNEFSTQVPPSMQHDMLVRWAAIIKLLLEHKADVTAQFNGTVSYSFEGVVSKIFQSEPQLQQELLEIIRPRFTKKSGKIRRFFNRLRLE